MSKISRLNSGAYRVPYTASRADGTTGLLQNNTSVDTAEAVETTCFVDANRVGGGGAGSLTLRMQHSDSTTGSTFVTVSEADVAGDVAPGVLPDGQHTVQRFSYVGSRRYIKWEIVATGTNTGGGAMHLAVVQQLVVASE